jgi:hypothetical protein
MDNTAVRAARMMNAQAGMLRLRLEQSKPQQAPEDGGMLFKRSVQVAPNTNVVSLLQKWNPGVPDTTLADMIPTVCRWNQITDIDNVPVGRQLLIPTVIPHGQQPASHLPMAAPPRTPGAPVRTPGMALSSSLVEQRARQVPSGAPQGIWATGNQPGQNLAGAQVKNMFQANAWARRA